MTFAALALALLAVCPPQGSATSPAERLANMLKNRTERPSRYQRVTVKEMIAAHSDPVHWPEEGGAVLEGYVVKVKHAVTESCNCFDPARRDWHISVAASRRSARAVIVEITPRVPVAVPKAGEHVRIRGLLFFDGHHEHEPGRLTAWEVHPVLGVEHLN